MSHVYTDEDARDEAYRDYAEDADYQREQGYTEAPTMSFEDWLASFRRKARRS